MEKESNLMQIAKEGTIKSEFTENGYFVKFKPALAIDKVCFSFVKKGSKGDGFDIYVGTEEIREWMEEILSPNLIFEKKMEREKQSGAKYPGVYKYLTGEKGEKSVAIGAGMKSEVVINGSLKKKSEDGNGGSIYANVPCSIIWMRSAMRKLNDIFKVSQYWENIAKTTLEASTRRGNNTSANTEPKQSETLKPQQTQAAATTAPTNDIPTGRSFGVSSSAQKPTEQAKPTPVPQELQEMVNPLCLKLQITSKIEETKSGNKCFKAITAEREEQNVFCPITVIQTEAFKKFEESFKVGNFVSFKGFFKKDRIVMVGIY